MIYSTPTNMSNTVHSLTNHPQLDVEAKMGGDFPLDENVIALLPKDTVVLLANRYGFSTWTLTARITTELADGTPKKYFLKCAAADAGQAMMEGKYWAMSELYKTIPSAIPELLARGKYRTENRETYFLLCEFVDMSNQVPDPDRFCSQLPIYVITAFLLLESSDFTYGSAMAGHRRPRNGIVAGLHSLPNSRSTLWLKTLEPTDHGLSSRRLRRDWSLM